MHRCRGDTDRPYRFRVLFLFRLTKADRREVRPFRLPNTKVLGSWSCFGPIGDGKVRMWSLLETVSMTWVGDGDRGDFEEGPIFTTPPGSLE